LLKEFYKIAIPADSIARAIAYAIEQPSDVEIDEIVVQSHCPGVLRIGLILLR
jgi:NADP-dependent 3-hydroxy acid dehydrogenase YdfG